MAEKEKKEDFDHNTDFSKAVRAGKRTYFFDVKKTKDKKYFLVITESQKRIDQNGRHRYERHRIFLLKEDFNKFISSMIDAIEFIRNDGVLPEDETGT